jgi:mRNA-degrading endonuclease toxin of MazEF toxin-antitoxin module
MNPRTGEIWWVEYGQPHPQQPALQRPALVISPAEPETWSYENLVTVPFTKRNRNKFSEVQIESQLPILAFQLRVGLNVNLSAQCHPIHFSIEWDTSIPRVGIASDGRCSLSLTLTSRG